MKYFDNIWKSVKSAKDSVKNYSGEIISTLGASAFLNDLSKTYHDTIGVQAHQLLETAVNIPHNYLGAGPAYDLKEVHDVAAPLLLTLGAAKIAIDKYKIKKSKKRQETYQKIDHIIYDITDEMLQDASLTGDLSQFLNNEIMQRAGLNSKKLDSLVESYITGKINDRRKSYNNFKTKENTPYIHNLEETLALFKKKCEKLQYENRSLKAKYNAYKANQTHPAKSGAGIKHTVDDDGASSVEFTLKLVNRPKVKSAANNVMPLDHQDQKYLSDTDIKLEPSI